MSDKNVEIIKELIQEYKTYNDLDGIQDLSIYVNALEHILAEREQMLKERDVANDSVIAHKFAVMQQQLEQKDKRIEELEEERESVLDLIFEYGQIDGEHHKIWVIDQIVRILTKDKYNEWIKNYVYDEETGDIYSWDKGIAP